MDKTDFGLEKRLYELDKKLNKNFRNVVFSMQFILNKYQLIFPNFTDHTMVHSLNVIEFCNKIIGDQIDKLNVDEIYIILLACYLHDAGMGISMADYNEFSKEIDFKDYFLTHDKDDVPMTIRSFHHEYSGLFIKKYAQFFELPSEEHMFALIQVCRGHRKVDLEDEKEYPISYQLPNGNTICLPYLAALLRMADEIDVTNSRNCLIDYDLHTLTNQNDLIEFMKHEAVDDLIVTDDTFIMQTNTDDEFVLQALNNTLSKMNSTLNVCRNAVNGRTKFVITQEKAIIKRM